MLKKRGKFLMKLKMPDYEIIVEKNSIRGLSKYIKSFYTYDDLFIVTDENVDELYHDFVKSILNEFHLHIVVIKAGEQSKSFATYLDVINQLMDKGIKRNHLILALGGGVVGDLTGFVAATLFRGIPYIQIPTTLLSQVDSSIGSKVGIDLPKGKNLIGAFYHPKVVFIDPVFLDTLSKREYNQGVAEMIKAGLIANKELYNFFKDTKKVTTKEILMAIEVKRDVVLKDPFDQKERMLLNFGHTFGHAIEKKFKYQTYKHGEAISYGMLIALEIGIKKGLTPKHLYESIRHTLEMNGLIKKPYFKIEDLKEDIKTDKKFTAEAFHFICLSDIGQGVVTQIKVGEL
jgi:3-dehydroquinate synthase